MILDIRHYFARPVVQMVAKLAIAEFDSWNKSFEEMRYYFPDTDGIQLSKDFPDVRGVAIKHDSSLDYSFSFQPTHIKLYVGEHVRDSGRLLTLTSLESRYLKKLLLKQHASSAKRHKARNKKVQGNLAREMARSLKKHIN